VNHESDSTSPSAVPDGDRPPAILLGGGPIALPVARSLARKGVRVTALGTTDDPVRRSRACAEYVDLGSGDGVQDRWLAWLAGHPVPGAVVLPCNDDALELSARHRARLLELGYRPAELDPEVTLAMLDKDRTYQLARACDVPTPHTVVARPGDDVSVADDLQLPCALKPRHSHLFIRHFGLRIKAFHAADRDELAFHLERLGALGLEMIVTEIIPGDEDAFCSFYGYLDERGESLLHLTKRKLRQYPPHFGLATYHMVNREPEVIELGLRFCRGVGLRGIGVVEFKRDPRDGALKLIECNARFTAATELVHHAGVDLAGIAYDRALGRRVEPVIDYRAGVRMWHPVEDARTAMALRREGELTTRRWLASLAHRQHFPLWSWRDPMPTVHSLLRRRRRLGARTTGGASRAAVADPVSGG
jgi:D-aspartate ligase